MSETSAMRREQNETSAGAGVAFLAAVPPALLLVAALELITLPDHHVGLGALATTFAATWRVVWPLVLVAIASALSYAACRRSSRAGLAVAATAAGAFLACLWAYLTLIRYRGFLESFDVSSGFLLFAVCLVAIWALLGRSLFSLRAAIACSLLAAFWIALSAKVASEHLNPTYPSLLAALVQLRFIAAHTLFACIMRLEPPQVLRWTAACVLTLAVLVTGYYLVADIDRRTRGWVLSETSVGLSVVAMNPVEDRCHDQPSPMSVASAEATFMKKSGYPRLPDDLDPQEFNVLLVTTEAVRADHTYLQDPRLTPSLKALADSGISFRQAVAPASRTIMTLGAMFTMSPASMSPLTLGIPGWKGRLRPEAETIAELFARQGYRTVAIRHKNFLRAEFGFDQGFESVHLETDETRPRSRIDENLATQAIREISGTPADGRRLFLWVHFVSPHSPYVAGPGGVAERYRSSIANVDRQLSRILKAVEEADLRDQTIVIFTSDHGEELGEHGEVGNHGTTVNSEAVRVPLVVRVPGVAPARVEQPVSTANVFPWLLRRSHGFRQPVLERVRREVAPVLRASDGAAIAELFDGGTDQLTMIWSDRKLDVDVRAGIYHFYRSDDLLDSRDLLERGEVDPRADIEASNRFRSLRACVRRATVEPLW